MKYEDIPGWFPDESAVALTELIKQHNVQSVIEIGSYLGKSAVFFAGLVKEVHCVDPFVAWEEGAEAGALQEAGWDFLDKFEENINDYEAEEGRAVIWTHRGFSSGVHKDEPELRADMVYIDGKHDLASVLRDIALWSQRANIVICGDDYAGEWENVRRAVDTLYPDRIINGRIWYKILKKI